MSASRLGRPVDGANVAAEGVAGAGFMASVNFWVRPSSIDWLRWASWSLEKEDQMSSGTLTLGGGI
jgi:hypothetical protein